MYWNDIAAVRWKWELLRPKKGLRMDGLLVYDNGNRSVTTYQRTHEVKVIEIHNVY